MAIGAETTRHLNHLQRQGQLAADLQGKQIGTLQVSKTKQISKPPVDQQQHRRAPLLQQGIGGHRGAQPELLQQSRAQRLGIGKAQQLAYGIDGRITWDPGLGREHLAHPQLAAGGEGQHIGKGAAPVDPDPPAQLSGNSQTAAALRRLAP